MTSGLPKKETALALTPLYVKTVVQAAKSAGTCAIRC